MIRKFLDSIEPHFKPGGRLHKLYPLYEANDTFLYTSPEVTSGPTHVRDAIDTKRMMSMVIVALVPCIFMAMYNTGYQAQRIYAAELARPESISGVLPSLASGDWRFDVLEAIGISYTRAPGYFLSPRSLIPATLHGALYFLPIYLMTMLVGGICEVIFSVVRGHEINEGFLVTGMLFPLTLPPTVPLWQVALGIAFGVVVGKEIFGGTGRNFLNPALTGRAFLYFAYSAELSGNAVWTAVDGYTGATPLARIAEAKEGTVTQAVASLPDVVRGTDFWDCFIGNMHGSLGETSTLACLIGAVILIATRIGSWRIMAGVLIGAAAFSSLLWALPLADPIYNIPPWWHFVLGGFAFGTVYMATDPVSASMTETGKWFYGI